MLKLNLILIILSLFSNLYSQNSPQVQIYNSNWAATDALGRDLPMGEETGITRIDKYVGVFYFLWHGFHDSHAIYDNSKIISVNPDGPQYGPHHMFHWWGEPEAGYYRAKDPWVIRRNLQMLVNAGIDFLFIDATNAFTYLDEAFALCDIALEMREEGLQTPYILFHTHAHVAQTINKLYDNFYNHLEYEDLWFIWQGKPLIFGDKGEEGIYSEALEFFNFRYSWAWTPNYANHLWRWLDHIPQRYGWDKNPRIPEQITVSIAEHATTNIGASYSGEFGNGGSQPPTNQFKLTEFTGQGLFFKEQWQRAHEVDPEVVMITGWNEWIAMRMIEGQDVNAGSFLGEPIQNGDTYFVDAYNQEYNRDIEPMKGGHTDNRYYQMINNIRRFKGMPEVQIANSSDNIEIDANFSDWDNVQPVFIDPTGDTFHRNYNRFDEKLVYTNTTGRNDIIETRTAFDSDNLYFYVKTTMEITPHTDSNWMLLFINSDKNITSGWEGYDYALNMSPSTSELSSLHNWQSSDSTWIASSQISYCYSGSQMEISVPRNAVALNDSTPNFQFHWADNILELNNIAEFFVNGESAPDRRFSYNYKSSSTLFPSSPVAPTNLVCKAASGKKINLVWNDNSNNEDYFIVERSDSIDGTWLKIDTLTANSTSYVDSTLQANRTYYFRIMATNSFGSSSYSNIHGSTTFLANVPQAPSNLSATTVSSSQIDLSWNDNSNNESGFMIEIRKENNAQWQVRATLKTFWSAVGLTAETAYYFRVRAFNDIGYSAYSDSVRAETDMTSGNTWDFNTDKEGWINSSPNVEAFNWGEGGHIMGIVTGPDPHITSANNLGIDIEETKYIAIKMKNDGPSKIGQFYFATDSEYAFDESKSINFTLVANDTGFTEYIIDMSGNPKWDGTLKQLRADPSQGVNNGIFFIDYINIQNKPTGVREDNSYSLPLEFSLEQNYPNPFNPSTKISYHLAAQSEVTLTVYNVVGQKVQTLMSKNQSAGSYTVTFGGKYLTSGIYIYSLIVNGKTFSKKMIVMK